ncbi:MULTISPECIES: hypothetical protein [Sorangium]|uniref:Uncharacterized protein n=1 Tax=Sorangium cellulosum (strain So ce56) TaxID=448385 RepID=A9FLB6_SORC5|nr:hypothetical protein [Sorangium cellulosum]CAN95198.1 hypothetical protein predicted by Glimmer/Critica [Sorangium cellulosum So ce56]
MTCPHPSPRGALCVLAVCAFSLGWPRVVVAAPLPRLAVQRAPAAADCPDAPSLAVAVERVMERRALDPVSTAGPPTGAGAAAGDTPANAGGAPPGDTPANAGGALASADGATEIEVRFLHDGATYTAVLQAGGRTRQLSSEVGASCGELVEAVALTLAILLDSDPPAPAPAAPAPAAPAAAPVAPAPAPAALARAPVVPAPPRPPPRAARGDVSMELGAAQTMGMLDPFRAAAIADVSLRRRGWSAGVGGVWLPPQDTELAPGVVSLGLGAATARGCATIAGDLDGLRLSACAAAVLGAVYGSGKGFAPDREASAPWFALGGSAVAEGTLLGSSALGWSARATLLAPVARARFTVERRAGGEAGTPLTHDVALDPSPVGLLVGLSARVSIF